jgi:exopolyphosphatase/guanosine-5'-triphosphate,3'-diphosphate pyrophosphatase
MSQIGMDSRLTTKLRSVSKLWTVRRWATARLGAIRHERRVSSIAVGLANATNSLQPLNKSQIRLLKLAALVHDVGRCVSDKRHPEIGAKMILEDDSLPLRNRERRALAYLTQYHRDAVPEVGKDMILRGSDDPAGMRIILAYLRAADALDSRSLPSPGVSVSLRRGRLLITCRLREQCEKSRRVFSRRKKFKLLEEVLGCQIEVAVHTQRKLPLGRVQLARLQMVA